MKRIKRSFVFLIVFFIFFASCASNNPSFSHLVLEWMRSFGGELNDTANYLVSLEDGGFVGIGTTESSFPDNPNHGKTDILLAGFDSNGYKIWQKVFGGSENDYGESLIPTADGGFLILGVTESSDALADAFKLPHFGKKDIWQRLCLIT